MKGESYNKFRVLSFLLQILMACLDLCSQRGADKSGYKMKTLFSATSCTEWAILCDFPWVQWPTESNERNVPPSTKRNKFKRIRLCCIMWNLELRNAEQMWILARIIPITYLNSLVCMGAPIRATHVSMHFVIQRCEKQKNARKNNIASYKIYCATQYIKTPCYQ